MLFPVLLARTFFFCRIPKSGFGTKLTVKNATGTKTPANSASRRTESNGRRPGPGFGQNPGNKKLKLYFAYPSNPGDPIFIKVREKLFKAGQGAPTKAPHRSPVASQSNQKASSKSTRGSSKPPHRHPQTCKGSQRDKIYIHTVDGIN